MLWNARNGRVALGDAHMDCVSFGHGAKALVILPGLSDGLATVSGKALLLARPYRLYFQRYTIWMFSRRDPLPEGTTIRQMAADQARAMEALGLEKASVMGVSQGGMVAQYLAADCGPRVEKLVLAVTAPCVNERLRACVCSWIDMAQRGDHRRLMTDTAEKSYSEKTLRKMRPLYPILGRIGKPADYGRFLANARAILGFDAREALGRIACPTLILGGAEDRIVGVEGSRALAAAIPGSVLHVYEGLGHAAYEEAGDFNDRVFRFLDEG